MKQQSIFKNNKLSLRFIVFIVFVHCYEVSLHFKLKYFKTTHHFKVSKLYIYYKYIIKMLN